MGGGSIKAPKVLFEEQRSSCRSFASAMEPPRNLPVILFLDFCFSLNSAFFSSNLLMTVADKISRDIELIRVRSVVVFLFIAHKKSPLNILPQKGTRYKGVKFVIDLTLFSPQFFFCMSKTFHS